MAMGVVNGIISIDFVIGGGAAISSITRHSAIAGITRRDVAANVWPLRYFIPVMLLVVIGLLALLMGGNSLLWAILGGMVVLALLLGGIGWGSLLLLRHLTVTRLSLRLAINRLLRQPWMTLTQLAAFSLSFMLLALLLVLRGDLLDRWQQQLPPDSPNYFLLNMTPQQVPQVTAFLAQNHSTLDVLPHCAGPVDRN